jgi:hypothetical protein
MRDEKGKVKIIQESDTRVETIVLAWGNWGTLGGRDQAVIQSLLVRVAQKVAAI